MSVRVSPTAVRGASGRRPLLGRTSVRLLVLLVSAPLVTLAGFLVGHYVCALVSTIVSVALNM
ncbi:MAG: hypothetical protein JWM18_2820 [Chloroflexi bacterium]|jgi:hypothetical protein|nr:hypothetical protein [Chloroflexota bacterium]